MVSTRCINLLKRYSHLVCFSLFVLIFFGVVSEISKLTNIFLQGKHSLKINQEGNPNPYDKTKPVAPPKPTQISKPTGNQNPEEEIFKDGYKDLLNPKFLDYLRNNWIQEPSTKMLHLKSPAKKHFSENRQSFFMDKILKRHNKKGFFIECGAWDGETFSNSLYFERELNWSGLLIEPNKIGFDQLKMKNRHSYSINSCLSPVNATKKSMFIKHHMAGGLIKTLNKAHINNFKIKNDSKNMEIIQCFPLTSILAAINVSHVNFFSLDVEGAELPILKTIPFDKIKIDTFIIEYAIAGEPEKTLEKVQDIRIFFNELGLYLEPGIYSGVDMVIVRKDFMTQQELSSIFKSSSYIKI